MLYYIYYSSYENGKLVEVEFSELDYEEYPKFESAQLIKGVIEEEKNVYRYLNETELMEINQNRELVKKLLDEHLYY